MDETTKSTTTHQPVRVEPDGRVSLRPSVRYLEDLARHLAGDLDAAEGVERYNDVLEVMRVALDNLANIDPEIARQLEAEDVESLRWVDGRGPSKEALEQIAQEIVAWEQLTDDVVPDHCPGWKPCHYCSAMIHHGQDFVEIACPQSGDVYAHTVCYADVEAGRRAGCGGGA